MRLVLILGTVLMLFGGCSLQKTVPPVETYHLDVKTDTGTYENRGCRDKIIRVSLMEGADLMRRQDIYYTDDASKQYSYTRARWIESPSRQLYHLLERSISAGGLFKGVIPYKSQARNDWLLEGNIHRFIQVINSDGSSEIYVSIDLSLIDQFSRKVISVKRIYLHEKGVEPNVKGAVRAFDKLMKNVLKETNSWLNDECR
ncbi:MAG: hypothetical protein B5M52_05540 [Helicobacteraceae bacterium 4484_230]|nr:MAG: hypothetical protein B5M52_05540 [Helicobacteraceae bacterium 4484_230]